MKILKEQKVIVQNETIEEDDNEGLIALLGKQVTFFCAVYIYTGKLIGVNKSCIKLENPKIIYETGDFSTKEWKDAQKLPNELYLQNAMIESFGVVK
jgi:hypothetical protein